MKKTIINKNSNEYTEKQLLFLQKPIGEMQESFSLKLYERILVLGNLFNKNLTKVELLKAGFGGNRVKELERVLDNYDLILV